MERRNCMQRKNHSNVSIDTMSKLELPENKNQHIPDILKKLMASQSSYEYARIEKVV
jgi:hypothetical protein